MQHIPYRGSGPMAKRLTDLGLDISGMPPAELLALIKTDVPRLGKVVRDSGATAN